MQRYVIPVALASLLFGCGYSEDEWQAQLAKYNKLQQHDTDLQKQLDSEKANVGRLEDQLRAMGVDVKSKSAALEERDKALAEYKARAAKLEAIKQRFEQLKKKLDELTKIGLEVRIRRNRMVISLPGDVLFDSGRDTLKKEGEQILQKVSGVVRADKGLLERDYAVAGHTDSQPLAGGKFYDNWGLSLMRARQVLVYLIGKEGQLPAKNWSAAGFGDTDPIASNDSKEGQQKNRRCELIVMPDVDEMLDLKSLTND